MQRTGFAERNGEEHEAIKEKKPGKFPLKRGNEGSHPQLPKKPRTTEEQKQAKTSNPSTSGHGEKSSLLSTKKQEAIIKNLYLIRLERSLPPEMSSHLDSLETVVSNLLQCPEHEWEKSALNTALCISKIYEDSDNRQLKQIVNNIKHLLCPKSKWRSCHEMAIKHTDIDNEVEQTFAMIFSSDPNVISCYRGGKCCESIKCCSLVTDMKRIETCDKVMATLSYSKQIIITGSMGCQVFNIQKGYRMISYVGGSTFVGSCMYSRKLYVVDWKKKLQAGIIHEFDMKDYPSDIAVGPRQHILTTFAYINCVACYNLKGDTLFEINSVCGLPLDMPSRICADCNSFYFIESDKRQINRVSAVGGVSQVKIPILADNMAIDKNTMLLWNSSGQSCILETGAHFWPNEVYFHQAQNPTIDRHVYINNATDVKDIVLVSGSRVILVYWGRQIVLINGDDIDQSLVDSVELDWEPTAICRWNETQILVCFSETIQFISWEGDKLAKKSELETTVGYVQVSNKASNEVVALTVGPQPQVHMILIEDDWRVTVIALINLEHSNVSIAASPVNLLVADIEKCQLLFFSFCGKQLSVNKLKFKQRPWLVYSNGNHLYVVSASRASVVHCYNICGQFEGDFELVCNCLPQISAYNGSFSVVDTAHRRVVFYRHENWDRCEGEVKGDSDSWIIDIRYGRRLEKKVMIGAMCLLVDGHIVIADWGEVFQLLVICRNGDIVKKHPLPSLATAICRWGNSHFGVTLPLEKELWLFNCMSFDEFEKIYLALPYIRVCQLDDTRAVCYCDRPSRLDLVTVKGRAHVTRITDSPDYIKSIAVRHDTKDILTWDSRRVQSYNITNDNRPEKNTFFQQTLSWLGLGLVIRLKLCLGLELGLWYTCDNNRLLSYITTIINTNIHLNKNTFFQQTQSPLGGGCIDETLLYVTDKRRIFSLTIVEDSQVISQYLSGSKVGIIEQVDVLSGSISGNELLSSTVHFQDLTVTERGHHYTIPRSSDEKKRIKISDVAITDNNLIAVCDKNNRNLKLVSFKGRLLGTLPLEASPLAVCQCAPNTLAVFCDNNTLLSVKVQFPLSYRKHNTRRPYKYIAALSDGRLVCSWEEDREQYFSKLSSQLTSLSSEISSFASEISSEIPYQSSYLSSASSKLSSTSSHTSKTSVDLSYLSSYLSVRQYLLSSEKGKICSDLSSKCSQLSSQLSFLPSGVDIVNIEKPLTNHCIVEMESEIRGVAVIPQDIIAVASMKGDFSFFSCGGKKFYKVNRVISQILEPYNITSDDTDIYVTGELAARCLSCVVCLSHRGQYKHVFRHHTLNSKGRFRAVDCRGRRIVVTTHSDSLYVQGLTIDTEALPVSRLQGSPVKIQELDISAQGNTIICDMVNNCITLLKSDGQCEKSLAAGGVCFMGETRALVTIPHTSQLFALDVNNSLDIVKRWNTQVPYGRIRRLEQNLCFLCFHINLTAQHKVKVVGDTLEIMQKSETFIQNPQTGKESVPCSESVTTGRHKLRATCGNYVASSWVESDTISRRQLPWRTSQFAIPRKIFPSYLKQIKVALLKDDTIIISDWGNNTLTLTTLKGHILHEIHTESIPRDVCQWTDDTFIVTFPGSKELVFYNKARSPIKKIQTEKGYFSICKNKDNHLICCTTGEEYFECGIRKYRGGCIDILSITNGTVICSKDVTDGVMRDIDVTNWSVVVLKEIKEIDDKGKEFKRPILCWYTFRELYLYREKRTFPPDVRFPQQIAVDGKEVYLLAGRERIYRISPTDTCELYLNREQTDCWGIESIDISKSRMIITGDLSDDVLGARVYDMST